MPIGNHGNLAAFSFYVTKNLTTIEGGALATQDQATAEVVERLALHGLSLGAWERFSDKGYRHYEVVEPGFKYNMTDVQAALGIHQLPRLDAWLAKRAELAEHYGRLLADLPVTLPPPTAQHTRHTWHLYPILLDPDAGLGRDAMLEEFTRMRVGVGVHYRGVHLHPYFRDRYGIAPHDLPATLDISERTISLPLSPKITFEDQRYVTAVLRQAVEAAPRRLAQVGA